MSGGHPSDEELAEHAEGLLEAPAAAGVVAHVSGCPRCQAVLAGLHDVSAQLGSVPDPGPVPELVAARIDRALSGAAATRSAPLPAVPRSVRWRRRAGGLLAAAAVVGVVGVGGVAAMRGLGLSGNSAASSDSGGGAASGGGGSAPPPTSAGADPLGPAAGRTLRRLASAAAAEPVDASRQTPDALGSATGCDLRSVRAVPGRVVALRTIRVDGQRTVLAAVRRPDGSGTAVALSRCSADAKVLARADAR